MEIVSDGFRDVLYSGDAEHTAELIIGSQTINPLNIKSIKISDPIIDTTSNTFYIGTFISKQIEIEFQNAEKIDINGQINLSIGTKVDTETRDNMNTIIFETLPTLSEYLDDNAKIIDIEQVDEINTLITFINEKIDTLLLTIDGDAILNNGIEYTSKINLIDEIETAANTIKNKAEELIEEDCEDDDK